MHIRCIAHIINLVVQAFLYGLDEGEDPEILDWFTVNKDLPIYYDPTTDEEQIALEKEGTTPNGSSSNPILINEPSTEEERLIAKELEKIQQQVEKDQAMVEESELEGISRKSAVQRVSQVIFQTLSVTDEQFPVFSFVLLPQKLFHHHNDVHSSEKLPSGSIQMTQKHGVLFTLWLSVMCEPDGTTLML